MRPLIVDVDVDLVFDGAVDVSPTFDGPSTSRVDGSKFAVRRGKSRPKDTT